MKRIPLPAPCHLCGQTCLSNRRGRVVRRLDRADLGAPAERTDAGVCPWRQCPHRPSGHAVPPVIEDQRSYGVVASSWPVGDRPPVALSLHPVRAAAEADRDRLAAASPPRPRDTLRTDYDVVEFPHALIASQLDAAQEQGYEYGYEHAFASARERLREEGQTPAAAAVLRGLAERHPGPFADTVRHLFGVDPDVAAAVADTVRLGHALDEPLETALRALAAGFRPEDAP